MVMKTSSNIKISQACAADAVPIAELSRDLIEKGLGWRWRASRVLAMVREPECVVLTAHLGDTLLAFAIMEFKSTHAHLNLLATAPAYQRQGYARRLLDWLIASARIAGLDRITVEVRADNTKARAYYANLGFTFKRRLKGYYAGREDALQLVHLLMNPEIAAGRPC
jgi:ribosomal protein S18 acetylase RimI-like enzyme